MQDAEKFSEITCVCGEEIKISILESIDKGLTDIIKQKEFGVFAKNEEKKEGKCQCCKNKQKVVKLTCPHSMCNTCMKR